MLGNILNTWFNVRQGALLNLDLNAVLGSKLIAWNKDSKDVSNLSIVGGYATEWLDSSLNGNKFVSTRGNVQLHPSGLFFDGSSMMTLSKSISNFEFYAIFSQAGWLNGDRIIDFDSQFIIQQTIDFGNYAYRLYSYVTGLDVGFDGDSSAAKLKIISNGANSLINDSEIDIGSISASLINLAGMTTVGKESQIVLREIIITDLLTDIERRHVVARLNYLLGHDTFIIQKHTVVEDQINGTNAANTGLAYDKNRRLIYVATTADATPQNVRVFDENFNRMNDLPFTIIQGFDFDPVNDRFIVWHNDLTLKIIDYDGNVIRTQSCDPYGDGTLPGSVAYDYSLNRILFTADGNLDIIVWAYNETSGDYEYNSTILVGDAQEGVCYDGINNCYWYRNLTSIKKINKNGMVLKSFLQPSETMFVNEGLAFNENKNSMYINSDKYFHGLLPGGNKCVEIDPYWNE